MSAGMKDVIDGIAINLANAINVEVESETERAATSAICQLTSVGLIDLNRAADALERIAESLYSIDATLAHLAGSMANR